MLITYLHGQPSPYLVMKQDGSLRDNGIETVTPGDGLFGEDLLAAIHAMNDIVKMTRPVTNYRTAFHVHIDVRDMEAEEIHNMLFLYCLLEQPIFTFVGNDRYNSNFCVPWSRGSAMMEVFRCLQNPDNLTAGKIKGLQRYSACNAQAIAKLGTVEFRQMQNVTTEVTTHQVAFINLVMSLKRLAVELYGQGVVGPMLYEWAKSVSPDTLLERLGFPLPQREWDYSEALMLASQMIEFKRPKMDVFVDVLYVPFMGKHANWR
jgi:hypothetical protein